MSKLSEPVAKALQAILDKCKGDTMIVTRTITGNFCAEDYFHNLVDEIKLLRCANFDDILIALVEGLPQAIKTTEQPSAAAAVEGILTEEELREQLNRLLGHDGVDGTYYYCLTRVKEAFNVGTMTLDDFVEIDEQLTDELIGFIKPQIDSLLSVNAELTERNRLLVLENDALNSENLKLRHTLKSAKYYLERDAHLPAEKIINEVSEELK